jgi:hypothetical protein
MQITAALRTARAKFHELETSTKPHAPHAIESLVRTIRGNLAQDGNGTAALDPESKTPVELRIEKAVDRLHVVTALSELENFSRENHAQSSGSVESTAKEIKRRLSVPHAAEAISAAGTTLPALETRIEAARVRLHEKSFGNEFAALAQLKPGTFSPEKISDIADSLKEHFTKAARPAFRFYGNAAEIDRLIGREKIRLLHTSDKLVLV